MNNINDKINNVFDKTGEDYRNYHLSDKPSACVSPSVSARSESEILNQKYLNNGILEEEKIFFQ